MAILVNSKGMNGGLCVMWQDEVTVMLRSFSKMHIDCSMKWKMLRRRFTGLHGLS